MKLGDALPLEDAGLFDIVRNSGNSSSEDNVLVDCWGISSQAFEGPLCASLSLVSFDFGGGSRPFPSHFSNELRAAIMQGCCEEL